MKEDSTAINLYDDEEELVSLEPIISFPIADQLYALPIGGVREVIKCGEITAMPQLPDHILGLVNVRGNVFAVLDLALVFGFSDHSKEYSYLIILDIDNFSVAIGVSNVPNTIHVNMDLLQTVQKNANEKVLLDQYVQGFIKHEEDLIGLLAVDQLISSDEFVRLFA